MFPPDFLRHISSVPVLLALKRRGWMEGKKKHQPRPTGSPQMTLRSAQIRHDRQRVTAQFVGQERRPGFSPGGARWGSRGGPGAGSGDRRGAGTGSGERGRTSRPAACPAPFPGPPPERALPPPAAAGRASCILPLEGVRVKSPPKHRSLRLTRASPARTLRGVLRREVNARALRSPCAGERG